MIADCGVAADRAGQVTTEEAMAVWLRHVRDSRDLGLAWSQREAGHRVKGEKACYGPGGYKERSGQQRCSDSCCTGQLAEDCAQTTPHFPKGPSWSKSIDTGA